jgi:hypothetical protein
VDEEGEERLTSTADYGPGAVGDLEFGEDVGDVVAYGLQAEEELFGDLLVIVSGGDEVQDLALAVGELGEDGSGCSGRCCLWSSAEVLDQAPRDARAEYGLSSRTMHHLV